MVSQEAKRQFKELQSDPHRNRPYNSPARMAGDERKKNEKIKADKLSKKYSATWTKKEMNTNWAGKTIKRASKTEALEKAKENKPKRELSKLEIRDQEYRKSRGLRDIDIKRGQVS